MCGEKLTSGVYNSIHKEALPEIDSGRALSFIKTALISL
jgi:hypothetical protein